MVRPTRVHDMLDVSTSHRLSLCGVLGRQPGYGPEFVEAFLASVEIVPNDWRERSEDWDCPCEEIGTAPPRSCIGQHGGVSRRAALASPAGGAPPRPRLVTRGRYLQGSLQGFYGFYEFTLHTHH